MSKEVPIVTLKEKSVFRPHIYLENLLREKFNVFIEVSHDQFNPPILNYRNKPIRARTTVQVFGSVDDAIKAKKNPGTVCPIVIAVAECSDKDTFVKREGLSIALHRAYRLMAETKKAVAE